MRTHRWIVGLVVGALLLAPAAVSAEPHIDDPEYRERIARQQGQEFCFNTTVIFGTIVIQGNRCYTPYLVRTVDGGFLGLGPSGPLLVPPGQLVRLNTPAGAKTRGRLFYLIPLPRPVHTIPVGTMQFIRLELVNQPGRAVFILPRGTAAEDRAVEIFFVRRR